MTTEPTVNPVHIAESVKRHASELTFDGVKQFFIAVELEKWRYEGLSDVFDALANTQAAIFCNTDQKVDWLAEKLRAATVDIKVSSMHGGAAQMERDAIMAEFLGGSPRVLITTDAWARDTDVAQMPLILNYEPPEHREDYLSRIGRSVLRPGLKRVTINFITVDDVRILRDIVKYYSAQVDELPMPFNLAEWI